MKTITHEELMAQLKDLPPVHILPKSLPIHPYEPYANILYNTANDAGPTGELKINVLKARENNLCAEILENCPKCGKDWLDHEFGVPAPYCP